MEFSPTCVSWLCQIGDWLTTYGRAGSCNLQVALPSALHALKPAEKFCQRVLALLPTCLLLQFNGSGHPLLNFHLFYFFIFFLPEIHKRHEPECSTRCTGTVCGINADTDDLSDREPCQLWLCLGQRWRHEWRWIPWYVMYVTMDTMVCDGRTVSSCFEDSWRKLSEPG